MMDDRRACSDADGDDPVVWKTEDGEREGVKQEQVLGQVCIFVVGGMKELPCNGFCSPRKENWEVRRVKKEEVEWGRKLTENS